MQAHIGGVTINELRHGSSDPDQERKRIAAAEFFVFEHIAVNAVSATSLSYPPEVIFCSGSIRGKTALTNRTVNWAFPWRISVENKFFT